MELNVLGTHLAPCSYDPLTGFHRDGCCSADPLDVARHLVCVKVTAEFLNFSMHRGNDLSTPRPQFRFRGLVPGDRWCLCALRWSRAGVELCRQSERFADRLCLGLAGTATL